MSCLPFSAQEVAASSSLGPEFRLISATDEMAVLLSALLQSEVFEREGIVFARELNSFKIFGAERSDRALELLLPMLSENERQAVSVFSDPVSRRMPRIWSLDDWLYARRTEWFTEALEKDRFESWFQPIVDTSNHEIFAHECLIRLNSGRWRGGQEIVDTARTRGLTRDFDSYARQLAMRYAARQSREGRYFINIIPSTLENPERDMSSTLAALAENSMRPENFVFEAVDSDSSNSTEHLKKIRDFCRFQGFGFALGNAGPGSGSLKLLSDLRPDYVKIDRSLIAHIEQPVHASAVQKLVDRAARSRTIVIAEGLEKPETIENLWLLGVHFMQGYLFGRPAPRIVRQRPSELSPWANNSASGWFGNRFIGCEMLDPDLLKLSKALAEACHTAPQPARRPS